MTVSLQEGDKHRKVEVELMLPQAKDTKGCQQTPEAGRRHGTALGRSHRSRPRDFVLRASRGGRQYISVVVRNHPVCENIPRKLMHNFSGT